MFARSLLFRAVTTSTTDLAKRPASSTSVPTVSPAVIRSLYRSLYREVSRLDRDPVLKVLFPCNKELQTLLGTNGALHVPGGKNYTKVLRDVFRDPSRVPKINLAFETLNRLRAHYDNIKAKLPVMEKDRARLLTFLQSSSATEERKELFRASPVAVSPEARPKYVQAAPGVPTRVVLRDPHHSVDLEEGTLLLAHPLSSAHVDRRVMLITERTPVLTSAVVLDLQFTFPLSRGNAMFPEVFWHHDVYDGGFSQIEFTMPPTAQIAVLHTLEPRVMDGGGDDSAASASSSSSASGMMSWLKWKDASSDAAKGAKGDAAAAVPSAAMAAAIKKHHVFCQPLVQGGVLDDGTREPTLYLSKAEALPYLSELAAGQPRSSLRIYWGNMRWTTAQLEAEVANGHWMAVKASPSFFRAYSLTGSAGDAVQRFPTAAQLAESKRAREAHNGADVAPTQVFPPDQILRRRECLWDEIMFAMGGEYAALVGCSNPFSNNPRGPSVQILAPYLAPLPLAADEEIDAALTASDGGDMPAVDPLGEDGDDLDVDELFSSGAHNIVEHTVPEGDADDADAIHDGVPGEKAARAASTPKESPESKEKGSASHPAAAPSEHVGKTEPSPHKDKDGQ